ncbi:hypothetical protein B0A50_04056 [Salinomyces thailandicus]|uniref:Peptidase S54 rhomboid domain-containing protein n=1 Tax=Salinomyces thailandicus TaxID=706561 RepID=A0A4U0TZH7_9PEZI|nr:hypothetical protein B0A50_04056 [Salinomyces thailandica]
MVFNHYHAETHTIAHRIFHHAFSNPSGLLISTPTPPSQITIYAILGLNASVFALWNFAEHTHHTSLLRTLTENTTVSRPNFQAGRTWTMVTSAFSHRDLAHLFANMTTFNSFASALASVHGVGAAHLICLTFGSTISGSFAFLLHEQRRASRPIVRGELKQGRTLQQTFRNALGASAVCTGFGAALTCLMPHHKGRMPLVPGDMPLWAITGVYVLADTLLVDTNSWFAHAAHLGGTLYGLFFYFVFLRPFGGVWCTMREWLDS